jgi:hypothetical protein
MLLSSFFALLRHQLRLLAQNRSACLILIMFVALAGIASRIEQPQSPVCYILYWQHDSWVERLKSELPSLDPSLAIEIVPAERFANAEGVIEYPPGAHSIQLRPPSEQRDHWLIWFWYRGARAEVLNPVADWFWSVTQRHFGQHKPMHTRVSSLGTRLAILDFAGPTIRSFVDRGQWKGPVVWGALLFCGCYLPAMALAQQREDRSIYTLVTTPVGWAGVGLATSGFYFALTTVVSLSLAITLGCGAGVGILLAAAVYVSVGFTLGCWCNTAASASAGMLVYLTLASGVAMIAQFVLGLQGTHASVELQVLQLLRESPVGLSLIASLAAWVMFWFLVARLSFRRLQLQ